jgi:hypothetical protein
MAKAQMNISVMHGFAQIHELGTHMAVPDFERLETALFCLIWRTVTISSQYK